MLLIDRITRRIRLWAHTAFGRFIHWDSRAGPRRLILCVLTCPNKSSSASTMLSSLRPPCGLWPSRPRRSKSSLWQRLFAIAAPCIAVLFIAVLFIAACPFRVASAQYPWRQYQRPLQYQSFPQQYRSFPQQYRPQQFYRPAQTYPPQQYYGQSQPVYSGQPYVGVPSIQGQPQIQGYQPQFQTAQPIASATRIVTPPGDAGLQPPAAVASNLTLGKSTKSASPTRSDPPLAKVRVPGEFEPQRAIMLSVSDWVPHHFPILQQIVDATAGHVNLLVLYNDLDQLRSITKVLSESNKNYSHVFFSPLELDTIWLRDFGPRVAELDDGWISIDFFYEGSRPRDDAFPRKWAGAAGLRLRTVRWTVQGGNFISNGAGLGLTTNRIFQDNYIRFPNAQPGQNVEVERREMVTYDFKRCFNLDQLVVLEPLQQEATKHADMFVTMLAPDRALVAQLDPWHDATNAAILDRNARKLAAVRVNDKPMEVHRIRIPPRQGTYWSPYTNIILANDLLLMPTFDSDDPSIVAGALATYRRLLPRHTVKTIDMTSMKSLQGSLHCLSMNLPAKSPWPSEFYTYKDTVDGLNRAEGVKPSRPAAQPK